MLPQFVPWAAQVVGVQPGFVLELVLVLVLVFVLVFVPVLVLVLVSLLVFVFVLVLVLVFVFVLVLLLVLLLSPPLTPFVFVFAFVFLLLLLLLDFLAAASSWASRDSSVPATGTAARSRSSPRRVPVAERVLVRVSNRWKSMLAPMHRSRGAHSSIGAYSMNGPRKPSG
jgi:hypothetical protein